MSPATAKRESRAERRKRDTRERLLGAALEVFRRRGFDAATTGEMAAAADVGAGTFYLHFRDKRDVYEAVARHGAAEMIERWRAAVPRGSSHGERVAIGLEIAADFWREDVERARLLLEGGPSFGSEAHFQFVREVAELIRRDLAAARRPPDAADADVMAATLVGLGIELGRLIAAGGGASVERTVERTIALARRIPFAAPAALRRRR